MAAHGARLVRGCGWRCQVGVVRRVLAACVRGRRRANVPHRRQSVAAQGRTGACCCYTHRAGIHAWGVVLALFVVILVGKLAVPPYASGPSAPLLSPGFAVAALRHGFSLWDSSRVLPFLGIATRCSLSSASAFADRARSIDVITICHPDWHGIRAATYAQGHVVFEVPGMLDGGHFARLFKTFRALPALKSIVINGIPPSSIHLAALLREHMPGLQILFVCHGAPSNVWHDEEAGLVDALIQASLNGTVSRLGVVKNGLAPWLRTLGVEANTIWNFPILPPVLPMDSYSQWDGNVHIGLFGTGTVAKNVLTQLLALCSLEGVVIHVVELPRIPYVTRCEAPVIEHGFMPHDVFVRQLGKMDVNLYVSLSECFPMVVLESIAFGVPCITSFTSRVYAVDDVLLSLLVVIELDSPAAIATAVNKVVQRLPELVPRLKGLQHWLYAKARLEWDNVVHADGYVLSSTASSAGLRLEGQHDRRGGHKTLGELAPSEDTADPRLPYVPVIAQTRPAVRELPTPFTVGIVTYELSPVTGGGAGTVATALVQELLAHGHGVVMLAYLPCQDVDAWIAYMTTWRERTLAPGRVKLHVHCVPGMLVSMAPDAQSSSNIFMRRAHEVATVAKLVYERTPFDLLEVFDYVGIGFELLRNRRAHLRMRAREGRPEPASLEFHEDAELYISSHVPIVVRLHGTMQLVDQASQAPDAAPNVHLMYLMERYVLETATMLFAQSQAMISFYSRVYGLADDRFVLAPPPMRRALSLLDLPADEGSVPAATRESIQDVVGRCSLPRRIHCRLVLVVGRLLAVKGTKLIAKAMQLVFASRGDYDVHVVFVGDSSYCPFHHTDMTQCVKDSIEERFWHRVTMVPSVAHSELRWLVETLSPDVAVVASMFEIYSMVAHELAYLRVPLVVPNLPAFSEFFSRNYSFVARAGDEYSFAASVREALDDTRKILAIRNGMMDAPACADPMLAYMHRTDPADDRRNLHQPLPLLDQAIVQAIATAGSDHPSRWPCQ